MSRTERSLWFNEARTELLNWPRRALIIWAACFIASLLMWFTAIAAKNATYDAFSASASVSTLGGVNSSAAGPVSAADNPAELVILSNEPTNLLASQETEPLDDQQLKRISETALTLHSRLQQGTESAALHASKAGRVAGLAVAIRQDQLTNSDQSFWQPISEAIADLERAVRLGEVSDGPAIGLVTELRSRYAELRVRQGVTEASPEFDEPIEEVVEPTEFVSAVVFDRVDSSTTPSSIPLTLRVLPWLAALLPLGCLLFGVQSLLQQLRERHNKNPRAGYSQVASKKHASQMSAEVVQPNRHAAERRTQAAILQLLDEMEPLAEGDLTHVASVTEDLTGALADAFNQAVYELRRLVKQINRSSDQVRGAVSQSRERTLQMAQQGALQAREVTRTNDRLGLMQSEVQSLSVTTQAVAEHAQDVSQRTQHAVVAVSKSCDALAAMRKQADVAERSMDRLVNSTQGIESRLVDIQNAAKSTDLLALNSTIHAASQSAVTESSAFDSTHRATVDNSAQNFSELANDVSSLASLLGSATRDVNQLSDVIRDEAKDSLKAMRATVAQVEATTNLSRDAQHHLDEIAVAADKLGEAVLEIANRTAEQALSVTDVASTTQVINDITHNSATALTQAAEDLQQLENLSNALDASVHGFRLPPDAAS